MGNKCQFDKNTFENNFTGEGFSVRNHKKTTKVMITHLNFWKHWMFYGFINIYILAEAAYIREKSYLRRSPFLASSWQVTAITWAKVMTRQRVIPERNEGPMSGCQTRSVPHEEVKESPTPGLQHPESKSPNIPECDRLLDERSLRTETSSFFKLPPRQQLPPTLSLSLSSPLSSSFLLASFQTQPPP